MPNSFPHPSSDFLDCEPFPSVSFRVDHAHFVSDVYTLQKTFQALQKLDYALHTDAFPPESYAAWRSAWEQSLEYYGAFFSDCREPSDHITSCLYFCETVIDRNISIRIADFYAYPWQPFITDLLLSFFALPQP